MTYVRNAWYVAEWSVNVPVGKPFGTTILGEPIVIFRKPDGGLAAMANRCVHRGAPLSLGRCEADGLRCMYHGMLYNAAGCVTEIPGQDAVPPNAKVKTYPVVEKDSWVWVWMGDTVADAALVPKAIGLDDPNWLLGHGHMDYDAEAQLINDNLLDFSHLSYVHASSFQVGDSFAQEQPVVTPLDRGIRYERWTTNAAPPLGANPTLRFDNYITYDFLIPGILLMWSGGFPLGTAAKFNHGRPDFDLACNGVNFTNQAVTPLQPGKARYLFSWGPHCKHGDAILRDNMIKLAYVAFNEDKTMIEAQQKVLHRSPDFQIMPSRHDRTVLLYTRLVEKLAKQEVA
jgi:nitrite reductase/ring-hydroxylating ferredoxin subunit